jgi:tetratricopeptide (TPR) repeat protein
LCGGAVFRVARGDWNFEELATIALAADESDTNPGAAEELLGEARRALPGEGRSPQKDARQAKVYRLRGPKEREQRMRERAGGGAALIGRELELKALKDAYRDVCVTRMKHHVLLIGEEGIGKRSLVTHFLKALPAGEALVLRAAARAATSESPFSIVADLGRDLLGLAEGAEPREVKRRLMATAAMLYSDDPGSRELQGLVETMGMLLGIKTTAEEIDADERRGRILQALLRIEEKLAKDRPMIVIVEDVHWADSQSWDVFFELITEPSPRPILGIATARPDERILTAARQTSSTSIQVHVGELGAEDRLRLVMDRFPAADEAAVRPLAEQIVGKAGGNPFFLTEMVDSLVERGILAESKIAPGKLQWVRHDAQIAVPTSVEALVATRLDRLPNSEKETASRGAIYGREFVAPDVAWLVGRSVDDDLANLVRRQILSQRPNGFEFRNETTQTVAYDLLPSDERAHLHRRAAERLIGAKGYRAGQDDAIIARHLERAGERPAAARRYLAAAMHARDVRGNVEAFRHLGRAIALLPRDAHDERFAARVEREAILRAWAHRPQQLRELHLMRREVQAAGDSGKLAGVLTRLGQFYLEVGKQSGARRVLGPAADAARAAGDKLAEAEVLRLRANLARSAGENAEALALCDQALALCDDARPGLLQRALILSAKGTVLWYTSQLREAIETHAEALVIYRKLRVPRQEARALNNIGIVFSALGEFEESLANYKRALKIDQELGDRAQIALKLSNIGSVYVDVGDPDKAEQYLVKALSLADQLKDGNTSLDATITLGQAYLKRAESGRAKKTLERGLQLAREQKNRYQEIRGLIYLAIAKLRSGDAPDETVELAKTARDLAHQAPLPIGEIYALTAWGMGLARLGRPVEAADRTAEAVRLLDSSRSTEGSEEILHIHARLSRAAGRESEATRALTRAHEELQSKARRLRDPALRAQFLAASPAKEILADANARAHESM